MAAGGGGGGASSGAIRAGGAFVELLTKDDQLKSGLDRAKAMVRSFAGVMAGVGAGLAAAGGAILAPLTKLVNDSVGGASEMKSMADRFGVAVETMSTFAFAAKTAGIETEELDGILTVFARHVHEAASGSGELAEKFAAAGLNAAELAQMTPVDQVLAFAEAMQHTANATERLALETELGGRSFSRLDSMLRKGPGFIRGRMALGKSFGAEVSPEEAEASKTIKTESMLAKAAVSEAVGEIGDQLMVALAGPIKEVTGYVLELAKAFKGFAERNQELIVYVAAVGAGLTALGAVCLAVSGTIWVVTTAWAGLVSVVTGAVALFTFFLTPAGLIVAALAAVAAGLAYLVAGTEGGRAAVSSLWGTFKTAFGGVLDALLSGDFKAAAAVAWTGVKYVWRIGVLELTKIWNSFKAEVVDGFHQMVEASAVAWEQIKYHASPLRSESHRDKNIADIKAEFDAEQALRNESRARDEADAAKDVRDAKDELDRLNALVAANRAAKKAAEQKPVEAKAAAVAGQMAEVAKMAGSVGAFGGGGSAGSQMFAAMTSGPLVQAAKETAKNTAEILTETKKQTTVWQDAYGTLTLEYE